MSNKTKTISLRLTQEQYNYFKNISEQTNNNVSECIRQAVTNAMIKKDNTNITNAMVSQVNKIGNNINQIAKNLNIAKNKNQVDEVDFENITDVLLVIEDELSTILKKIRDKKNDN